jgi:hypothetical protein
LFIILEGRRDMNVQDRFGVKATFSARWWTEFGVRSVPLVEDIDAKKDRRGKRGCLRALALDTADPTRLIRLVQLLVALSSSCQNRQDVICVCIPGQPGLCGVQSSLDGALVAKTSDTFS